MWRPVKEDILYNYEVSIDGKVRNVKTGRLLTPSKSRNGYILYYFRHPLEKKNIGRLAHRLVAEAFIPNPDNKKEVNHLDFDKENNHADNLRWATKRENIVHAVSSGRYLDRWVISIL